MRLAGRSKTYSGESRLCRLNVTRTQRREEKVAGLIWAGSPLLFRTSTRHRIQAKTAPTQAPFDLQRALIARTTAQNYLAEKRPAVNWNDGLFLPFITGGCSLSPLSLFPFHFSLLPSPPPFASVNPSNF